MTRNLTKHKKETDTETEGDRQTERQMKHRQTAKRSQLDTLKEVHRVRDRDVLSNRTLLEKQL